MLLCCPRPEFSSGFRRALRRPDAARRTVPVPIPSHLKDPCVPTLHSCTASHDTVSFSDGWRALHNTRTHKSVYAAKVNSVKSEGLFAKMSLMQFQWLVLLSFLSVRPHNIVRLPHSPDWTNILKKYAHPLGTEPESIMHIFQTLFSWTTELLPTFTGEWTSVWVSLHNIYF